MASRRPSSRSNASRRSGARASSARRGTKAQVRGRQAPKRPSASKRAAPPRARRSWLWRYRRLLFLITFFLFTAAAGTAYLLTRVPLPEEAPQAQTTFILDANGKRLASIDGGENRVLVKLKDVPDVLVDAVLAAEDKNFFEHSGLDPVGIARATWKDLRSDGPLQGGSTITQQYVKNTYVGSERTVWRKLKEAVLSIKIERKLDKPEILERYLNTIYFGRGAYGVQAAARQYFGADVQRIGLREAAYLAGLIRAPELADARRNPAAAKSRRARVLDAMVRNKMISPADRAEVNNTPLTDYVVDREKAEPTVVRPEKGTQYFVEYVRQQLVKEFGGESFYTAGYRVKTTLDLDMQAQAYDSVYGFLNRADDPAGALVSVDADGRIKAMVGGRDWTTSKVNLAAGAAGGGGGRQPGSTFKPFLLAETVRQGYTVESSFPAPAKIILPKANSGKDWPVENYEGAEYGAGINLIDATRNSVNTVYAQLVVAIGAEKLQDMAEDLGVKAPLQAVNSLALGTVDVSVLDMAASYSTFANRGQRVTPTAITEVTNADGKLVRRFTPERAKVLDEEDADVVNFVLRQAVERGTGGAAKFGRAGTLAGKTGTTQDYGDAWFVGYTSELTTAVWMGYPEGNSRKMTNVRGQKVSGGSFPARIFRRYMTAATKGMDLESFDTITKFPGKVLKGKRIAFSSSPSSTTPTSTTPKQSSTTMSSSPSTTEATKPPATTAAPTTSTTSGVQPAPEEDDTG